MSKQVLYWVRADVQIMAGPEHDAPIAEIFPLRTGIGMATPVSTFEHVVAMGRFIANQVRKERGLPDGTVRVAIDSWQRLEEGPLIELPNGKTAFQ